jgi:hypothetical protein
VQCRRRSPRCRATYANLEDEQLVRFLEKDAELAARMAGDIECFKVANIQKLAEVLLNNPDQSIHYRLASNGGTPKSILRKLERMQILVLQMPQKIIFVKQAYVNGVARTGL